MGGLNELLKPDKGFAGRVTLGNNCFRKQKNTVDFPRLPTGVTPVDYALGGGIPLNDPIQLFGPPQGGKTTLATITARTLSQYCMNIDCLKPLPLCRCGNKRKVQRSFLLHTEGMPPDPFWYNVLGYDYERHLVLGLPEYGEQGCEMLELALKSDDCGLAIVDSAAGLIPKAELDGRYLDFQVAAQPRLLSKMMRRISVILVNEFRRGHLVGVIFINHVRSVIGAGKFAPSESTPGGFAFKHGCRLSMRVSQLAAEEEDMNKESNVKNFLKFSVSMMGANAKQQLFVMAGKAEYKVAIRDFKGYKSGAIIDAAFTAAKARELKVIHPISGGYGLQGTKISWQRMSEVENTFKTGKFAGVGSADHVIRYMTVAEARGKAIKAIQERCGTKVQSFTPPPEGCNQLQDEENEESEE